MANAYSHALKLPLLLNPKGLVPGIDTVQELTTLSMASEIEIYKPTPLPSSPSPFIS